MLANMETTSNILEDSKEECDNYDGRNARKLNIEDLIESKSDDESLSLDDEVNRFEDHKCSLDEECGVDAKHENAALTGEHGGSSAPDL
ncbi:hypothetical protein L6452_34724 [Arctium lappa]|uniref:Uncharacterized protein n=1 Tax=Arctium lappa TaxID=4217 RepID=A0ACB8YJK6_ARCLA|nr:hypothetical protein L6452_34724 [Arctium lappa]